MMTTSEQELLQQARERFLHQRTEQEIAVRAWGERLNNCTKKAEVLVGIELPAEIELKSFVPEYYAAKPNPDVCKEQYDRMIQIFNAVNAVADKYNKEAKECLQELQAMNSKQS